MIQLVAYDVQDRIFRGRVELTENRVTDLLLATEQLEFTDLTVTNLRTRSVERFDQQVIAVRDLAIIVPSGPRGAADRRVRGPREPVSMLVHRYHVFGIVHAPALHDPLLVAGSRRWAPVTSAVLEQHAAGRALRERFDTLIVNRMYVTSMVRGTPEAHDMHWLAATPAQELVTR